MSVSKIRIKELTVTVKITIILFINKRQINILSPIEIKDLNNIKIKEIGVIMTEATYNYL